MSSPPGEGSLSRFLFADAADFLTDAGQAINGDFLADEEVIVRRLAAAARLGDADSAEVQATAARLVEAVRSAPAAKSGIDAFLRQYDLSSQEGVILMCLAEALLRIPDDETADRLIADKLRAGDWASHLGDSQSLFVNASTWGLMLTGRVIRLDASDVVAPQGAISRVVGRMGEPVVRTAMRQAMRIMGHQFVMGRTIAEALDNSLTGANRRYRYTFDMLGEAALTGADADRYFDAYRRAIGALQVRAGEYADAEARPSISVKLSALHPKFERAHRRRVLAELAPRLVELCVGARDAGVALTLEILEAVCRSPRLAGWSGFGIAVQAYHKRAQAALRFLAGLATESNRVLHVRLVKGAYWDAEIKRGQERGLAGYPVFTRKPNTDVSYLACARLILEQGAGRLYPQFATHNAHTVAAVWHMARRTGREFEFQRLHGMGEGLYTEVTKADGLGVPCRVYAPVGEHEDLLPYLVRRLLENGANTSFVNRIVNEAEPVDSIVADPVRTVDSVKRVAHPRIPLPVDLYQPQRLNSLGLNLADGGTLRELASRMERVSQRQWVAAPIISGHDADGPAEPIRNPANTAEVVGTVRTANAAQVDEATRRAPSRARPRSTGQRTCSSRTCTNSSRCASARRARPCRTALQRFARPWISCAITPRVPGKSSAGRCACRGRPGRATSFRCTDGACSSASAHGIFHWPFSQGRWPRRSRPAMPWSPSPPNRLRSWRRRPSGCCCRPASLEKCCISCRATAPSSARLRWRTGAWPVWRSQARPRQLTAYTALSQRAMARFPC